MKMRIASLLCLAGVAAAADAPAPIAAGVAVFRGAHSAIERPRFERVETEQQFAKLWAEHLGARATELNHDAIDVDWPHALVVAIFVGPTHNSSGVRLFETIEADDAITLRYGEWTYQKHATAPGGGADQCTPFGFFALPRTDKPIVIEERIQELKNDKPTCKERARLAPAAPPGRARTSSAGPGALPFAGLRGPQSAIAARRYERVSTPEQFAALWKEHCGADAADAGDVLDVDWSRSTVVAIFQGASINSRGVRFESVSDERDRILIRYDDWSYQTMSFGGDERGGAQDVKAFGFFVVPRRDKPIVIEENVQGLIGKPPIWKERAQLPAAATK